MENLTHVSSEKQNLKDSETDLPDLQKTKDVSSLLNDRELDRGCLISTFRVFAYDFLRQEQKLAALSFACYLDWFCPLGVFSKLVLLAHDFNRL